MKRYSNRSNFSTLSEINVTPLLDLAFVLLIIFMITTPLLENSMNLVIPSSSAANAPISKAQVQTISIDRDETIRMNNETVDADSLAPRLLESKRARLTLPKQRRRRRPSRKASRLLRKKINQSRFRRKAKSKFRSLLRIRLRRRARARSLR